MDRELYGGDHLDVATSLFNLGGIRLARGDLAGAEARYLEALEMRRRLFGEHHAQVAISLGGLARLEEARGDLDAAERHLAAALEVRRVVHGGDDHPYVVTARGQLEELRARRAGGGTGGP
jgi:tetratricopeptide (TPR) repeat protein